MKKFFNSFRILPTGVYRLNLVCSFLFPLILAFIAAADGPDFKYQDNFINSMLIGIVIYWILARTALWVYEGFKRDRNE